MQVCTIIAKNYVAFARVLARSLAQADPDTRLWTLVIDDVAGYIDPEDEPFELLTPADVGCDEFTFMALRYSVLELSTAVKPWLLRHLLERTGGPVTYLDPDIRVYSSLGRLDALADEHGLVLTPHNSQPIPADGRRPSQVDVMIAGVYNLGYVSLAAGSEIDALLDWWSDRLRRDCRVDPTWGYFVDQRWFDLAPGFVSDLAIMREPQYNVAYWNLQERRLERAADGYLVDDQPLRFFHFSGFDPERPLVLSRHQDRIDVVQRPVLERLLAEYAAEVLAEGHAESRHWPYGLSALGDGTRLDDRLRQVFDEYADRNDGRVPSPFTLEGTRAFDRWLIEQPRGAPEGINRAFAQVYESREDLRGAFPDLAGGDREPYLEWIRTNGVHEDSLLARAVRLQETTGAAAALSVPATSVPDRRGDIARARGDDRAVGLRWGANVVELPSASREQRWAADGVVSALDVAGVSSLPVALGADRARASETELGRPRAVSPDRAPFFINVLCFGSGDLVDFAREAGDRFFAGRYSVGVWSWPLERFPPELADRFSLLEEVWAPSAFSANALSAAATVPVHVVPLGVAPAADRPRTRVELGISPESYVFGVLHDHSDDMAQANPLGAIEAFRRAFAPGEDAMLLIECVNADADRAGHAQLVAAALAHPDIRVESGRTTAEELTAVTASSDCHVSLHRATAFGPAMAEAMWLAKPVVATGYSGNLEYMTDSNSRLIGYQLVAADADPGLVWADPDLDQAAREMRQLFEDRVAGRALGAAAAEDIRASHGSAIAAAAVGRRIDSILATGRPRRPVDPVTRRPPVLARLPHAIAQGPPPGAGGRGGAARDQLRELMLRVIKPYTAFQRSVDTGLVQAIEQTTEELDQLRKRADAERAEALVAQRHSEAILHSLRPSSDDAAHVKRLLTESSDRSFYLALAELTRRHREISPAPAAAPPTEGLAGYELRVSSQNGEDGVLAELLRRTGSGGRTFVEFGVESGREGNCVFLADVAEWDGLFIEADPEMFAELSDKYAATDRIRTMSGFVTPDNVEERFVAAGVPIEIDVLSIDVDGQDYWIWEAIERFRPRIVIIEYNAALPPNQPLVVPRQADWSWDGSDYYGASLGALRRLAAGKGYQFVHTEGSGVNAFFVRDDLAPHALADGRCPVIRGFPNFYQRGIRHPQARPGRRYLDLESGQLVSVRDARGTGAGQADG